MILTCAAGRVPALVFAMASTFLCSPLWAQSAAGSDDDATVHNENEILVTANRRTERLQDVPIAVNVFSAQSLKAASISDIQYLSSLVPGLTITKTVNSQYFLRGIGTSSTTINSEQSVASYIDGVYVFTTYGSLSLANLDRVEVLRGPQGTLFGRNTTGGVIQAVTPDPLARPSLNASLGYGNFRTLTGSFYGNAHITPQLGVSLAVDFRKQDKGYGYNPISNDRVFFRDDVSVRGKIAYEPTDRTTITGFFQYRHTADGAADYEPIAGTRGLDGVDGSAYGRFEVRADAKNLLKIDSYLGYVRVEQKIGDFANLTSISSYHDMRPFARFDQDGTPLNIVKGTQDLQYRDFSQEVQLGSKGSGPLTWTVGAYYYNALASFLPLDLTGSFTGAAGEIRYFRKQKSESLAGFGQLTYQIIEGTKITAGLRYTDETEKLPNDLYTLIGPDPTPTRAPFRTGKQDSSGWTWRLALDQKLNDHIMGYISWNRGLKSGGFTLTTTANLPSYAPEKLDSYEIGTKMEFLGGRIRINPALFLYKFKDIQFNVQVAGGSAVSNAARATIKGLDLDASLKISSRLELTGSFEYLDAKFDSFPNATFFVPNAAPSGGAATLTNQNASGNRMPNAPRESGTLGLVYTAPLSGGSLQFDGSTRFVGDQFAGPSNFFVNRAYTLVSAGLSWTTADKRLGVRVWADNLFNENYNSQVFESGPGIFRVPGAPRTFGVTLSTKM
jgi:iron complex outermembrane receptor protein